MLDELFDAACWYVPAVVAGIAFWRCARSEEARVRLLGRIEGALLVGGLVATLAWSAWMGAALDDAGEGDDLPFVPAFASHDELRPHRASAFGSRVATTEPPRIVRSRTWTDRVNGRTWWVETDPTSGKVVQVTHMWTSRSPGLFAMLLMAAMGVVLSACGLLVRRAFFARD